MVKSPIMDSPSLIPIMLRTYHGTMCFSSLMESLGGTGLELLKWEWQSPESEDLTENIFQFPLGYPNWRASYSYEIPEALLAIRD